MLRTIWRMKTPNCANGLSLLTLPVEILQSIRDLLPLSSVVCFTISSRHLLRILGSKTLHSLREKGHAWERKCFSVALEIDLPDWQLCYPCSLFHPVDPSNGPKSLWRDEGEPECVQETGIIDFHVQFNVRYQHVQLVMNRYRFGLLYTSDLERLCHHYQSRDRDSYVESIITASIENGGLILLVNSRVQLLNGWDKYLIDQRLPQPCRHNGVCFLFPDQTFSETLLRRRSHGDRPPCARCSQWKHCKFCSTRFLVKVQESRNSETNIVVQVWKWLGSCKDPFDPDWRNHCELPLKHSAAQHYLDARKRREAIVLQVE